MAERQPLQVVAKVEAGSAHDGNGTKAGVIGAFANHIGDALVTPEQGYLVNEVREKLVKIVIRAGASGNRCSPVSKDALISSQAIVLGVTQHVTTIELVQRECARPSGQPHRPRLEQLL